MTKITTVKTKDLIIQMMILRNKFNHSFRPSPKLNNNVFNFTINRKLIAQKTQENTIASPKEKKMNYNN